MIGGLFHMGSGDEYKKAARELPGFRRVSHELNRAQGRGVVRLCAARASDPRFCEEAQEVLLRPSVVHAGGESLTAS